MDSRQTETKMKDVQCQTTQLSSRQVQSDDCDMAVTETLSSATETDANDINQRQQTTTRAVATSDTAELVQVAVAVFVLA